MNISKVKLIAEIGWNHMGDMDLAKQMILSAKSAGADYAKFQTWSVKNLKSGPWDHDGRLEIYKKAELTEKKHYDLYNFCKENDIEFLTSVFNPNDLDMVAEIDNSIIKIPSHEVHNSELLAKANEMFDLVLVSTGASEWKEVQAVVSQIHKSKLILMHCVSTYPAEFNILNFPKLQKISTICDLFGYSGHYQGIDDAILAISLGASFIEKHFTLDNNLPGRDNKFAILESDFKKISTYRDNFLQMMIDHGLELQESELDIFRNYRGRWSK